MNASPYRTGRLARLTGLLSLALLAAPGCTDKGSETGTPASDSGTGGGDGGSDGGTEVTPGMSALSLAFDDTIPTVATVTWTTDDPGTSWVTWGVATSDRRSTPHTSTSATDHSVVVIGLVPGEDNQLVAHTELSDGSVLDSPVEVVEMGPPPADVPSITISSADENLWAGDGYILTSLIQQDASYVVLFDRDGKPVWWVEAAEGLTITTPKAGKDGSSIMFAQYDRAQEVDVGGVVRQPIAGGAYASVTRTKNGHHDFEELPGDRIAWLSFEPYEVTDDRGTSLLDLDRVLETAEGNEDVDNYDVIFDYYEHGVPDKTCEHFVADGYTEGAYDWTHGNSLMYDEGQDALFLMNKNVDNIIKIDRPTKSVVWELGGRRSDFTMDGNALDWWSHAHMSWIQGDEFMVFDNRYHEGGTVGTSRASAYRFDEKTHTVQQTWTYVDPDGNFVQLLGDVRRLDNGNYLVCWTSMGKITEVTPDGQVVWELENGLGTALGRVRYLTDLYDTTQSW